MTFTKEKLIAQAEGNITMLRASLEHVKDPFERDDISTDLRLAEIALASLEAEPVLYAAEETLAYSKLGELHLTCLSEPMGDAVIPLYTSTPAPVSVPDEATPENIEIIASTFAPRGVTYQWDRDECNAAADSWNACRATLLQGAEPVKSGLTLREGIAVIRNSGIAVDAEKIQAERDALNSPAIPDGYALVPVEPTAEMISSGIAAHYERSNIQIHDRPAPGPMECAYVAMLAAAPQQEAL
ncbi:hypothetical protein [Leclercia pneumoniae]|uniref:hypothetical protein n=1 Tax=Leclercia pneumoniae TaxID=2815358 RepID=UPI0030CFF3AA